MTNSTRKLNIEIAIGSIKVYFIFAIVLYVCTFKFSYVLGLTIGTIESVINFYLLSRSVENMIERKKLSGRLFFILRMYFLLVTIMITLKYPQNINLYTMVLGTLIVQIFLVISSIFKKNEKEG